MERRFWWATVPGVLKSQMWFSNSEWTDSSFKVRMLRDSLVAKSVKNLPAAQETGVQFLGQEDPLEKEMAIHSSILTKIPMDRGARQATVHWILRVGHNLVNKPPPPRIITNSNKLLVFKNTCLFLKFILSVFCSTLKFIC